MEKAKRFEDLWIWQKARELVKDIYEDFRSEPCSKDYGFRGQISAGIASLTKHLRNPKA